MSPAPKTQIFLISIEIILSEFIMMLPLNAPRLLTDEGGVGGWKGGPRNHPSTIKNANPETSEALPFWMTRRKGA
jgi:hypothetical protein